MTCQSVVNSISHARPLDFTTLNQVTGSPLFEPDRLLIKFRNPWLIEAPEGYSVLFMHPINRFDLPFTTLTGLVDCDRYRDSWIHFPVHWHDVNFNGVLPKGTPIAQCVAVKRETWVAQTAPLTAEEMRAGVRGDEVGRARAWRLSTAVPCVSRIAAPRLAETS